MATQPSWQESSRRSNRSPENNRRSERIRVNAFHFVPGSASVSMFVPDSVSFPDPAFVSVLYSDPISVPASDSVPESVSAPWVPHTSVLRVGLLTFPSVIPTEAAFWFTLSFEVPTRDLLFRPPPKQPSRNASVGAGLRPARAASANNCVRNPRRAQSNRLDIVVSAARAPPRRPRNQSLFFPTFLCRINFVAIARNVSGTFLFPLNCFTSAGVSLCNNRSEISNGVFGLNVKFFATV